jgi:hypothetical protein
VARLNQVVYANTSLNHGVLPKSLAFLKQRIEEDLSLNGARHVFFKASLRKVKLTPFNQVSRSQRQAIFKIVPPKR